jgi:hypothetical protein
LADPSQFFSILSDLKCYRSTFSSFTNHLSNAKPKDHQPKKHSKENKFVRIAKRVFHFELSYFIIAKLSHFLFKLSDLNCSEIAILRFTNHVGTLKATE